MANSLKSLVKKGKEIVASSVFQNVLSLQSVEFLKKAVPLVLVPYLARVLGAGGWGLVAFAKSFAAYLVMTIEYGFNLTVTRRISRNKDNTEELNQIFANVMGATAILVIVVLAGTYGASFVISEFENAFLLWATLGFALAQGLHPVWWFLGLEQMRVLALFEGIGKMVTVVTIFLFVNSADHAWLAVALYGVGSGVSTLLGFGWAFRDVTPVLPTLSGVVDVTKEGFSMFVYRWATSLYTEGNAFILGLLVAPQYVGYFAGAEKISRASWSILTPVGRALFPRLSNLVKSDITKARRLARISTGVLCGASVAIGIFIIFAAPQIVGLLLGDDFGAAVPVLQILAVVPLLTAIHNVLGVQWMLPLEMDWTFNTIVISGGLANLAMALLLVPVFSYYGMAYSFVIAKSLIAFSTFTILWKRGNNPLIY